MRVNIMHLRDSAKVEQQTMLMLVDEETLITVKGIGTQEYTWKVAAGGINASPEYDPQATLENNFGVMPEDGWVGQDTLGLGLVWACGYTFAHVVMDCIQNT